MSSDAMSPSNTLGLSDAASLTALQPSPDGGAISDGDRPAGSHPALAGRAGSLELGAVAAFGLLAGLYGMIQVLTQGHVVYNTGTDMMWGLLIANYAFWALASFGLSFIATLALGFGITALQPIVRRALALAIATIIAAMISLWLELGQPFLGYAIPLNLQTTSPMFWMGAFYFIYLGLLAVTLYRTFAPGGYGMAGRALSIAHFVAALLALITQGLMYGMMSMRPFWYSPVLPLYFLLASFLIGIGLMVLLVNMAHGFDRRNMPLALSRLMTDTLPLILLVTLLIYTFAVCSRLITGIWSNAEGLQAFHHMVASPLFKMEVVLGMITPIVLLALPRTRRNARVQCAAAALLLVGIYIARYEFVTSGQIVPLFKGVSKPEFIHYAPSVTEWLVVVLSISVALLIYVVAMRAYRLSELPGERT